jgi:hypothetical protein
VGARCGNSARRDLCGARAATRVPTPIAAGWMHGRTTEQERIFGASRGSAIEHLAHRDSSLSVVLRVSCLLLRVKGLALLARCQIEQRRPRLLSPPSGPLKMRHAGPSLSAGRIQGNLSRTGE